MFFYKGKTYAKVWKIQKYEKYMELKISTSETDKDGNFRNSNWWPRVIGHAFHSLRDLKEGDRIIIMQAKFENVPYKDADGNTKQGTPKLLILDAEVVGAEKMERETPAAEAQTGNKNDDHTPHGADSSCPW